MNATSTPSSIPTTDSAVAAALRTHGASAVYLAAHYWLTGDRTRLPALGIPNPSNVAEADRICTQAFRLLTPAEQAADWAQLQAELRRLAKA